MTIIVETGAIVTWANSYVSLAEARAWVLRFGESLPTDDAAAESVIFEAMQFLESKSSNFKGRTVAIDQPLSWPRTGAFIEGWYWTHTAIPRQVRYAQFALIREKNSGIDLWNPPAATNLPVIKERIGDIEQVFANPMSPSKVIADQESVAHIALLLRNSGLSPIRS